MFGLNPIDEMELSEVFIEGLSQFKLWFRRILLCFYGGWTRCEEVRRPLRRRRGCWQLARVDESKNCSGGCSRGGSTEHGGWWKECGPGGVGNSWGVWLMLMSLTGGENSRRNRFFFPNDFFQGWKAASSWPWEHVFYNSPVHSLLGYEPFLFSWALQIAAPDK